MTVQLYSSFMTEEYFFMIKEYGINCCRIIRGVLYHMPAFELYLFELKSEHLALTQYFPYRQKSGLTDVTFF